ncbi:thiol peroxidase [Limosilactobacillus sp.]|uniref:thiol peroxidase n=1 Tax=Limosilactobacillus sp. TaxID=2773925 RepID=UPI00345E6B82
MQVTIEGKPYQLVGDLPEVGVDIPHFKLFDKKDQRVKTREFFGKVTLFSVVPDINTSVCSIQTRKFNRAMEDYPQVNFITVSTNTVAEQRGWCAAQGLDNIRLLSDAEQSFGYALKVLIPDTGTLARSIFIMDEDGKIRYEQLVPEETEEPDYLAALNALKKLL